MSDPASSSSAPLRVVVLTCAGLGYETAAALEEVPGIEVLAVFDSPHRPLPLRRKIRKVWRARGARGLASLVIGRVLKRLRTVVAEGPLSAVSPHPRCPVIPVTDLHSTAALEQLRALRPDLGVVDGTYILKPVLFDLPRLGCINLHCGRVPEYRGAPPAFWELYDGVDQVGITIHRVTERLDEGPVFMESSLPLDTTPSGDPVQYVEAYWRSTLRPHGMELLKEAVAALRDDNVRSRPQREGPGRTHRFPTRHDVRELRRRVRRRRTQRA